MGNYKILNCGYCNKKIKILRHNGNKLLSLGIPILCKSCRAFLGEKDKTLLRDLNEYG